MRSHEAPGTFVVSLDLELAWGIRDSRGVQAYRDNLEGVRGAVVAMLERFETSGVHATWAAVGLLASDNADDAVAASPELRPNYDERRFDPYAALAPGGEAHRLPALHFAPDLLEEIAQTSGQEIGTHTFAHYYCLERGPSLEAFRQDIRAAKRAFAARGLGSLRAIVFPRNQYSPAHLAACAEEGIVSYRGNPEQDAYRTSSTDEGQTPIRRATRLLDAHVSVTGSQAFEPKRENGLLNIRASRFLRPARGRDRLRPLRLRRILGELRNAAETGRCFHLWWHPHNFGAELEANLETLDVIVGHFSYLRDRYGMQSRSMGELAA